MSLVAVTETGVLPKVKTSAVVVLPEPEGPAPCQLEAPLKRPLAGPTQVLVWPKDAVVRAPTAKAAPAALWSQRRRDWVVVRVVYRTLISERMISLLQFQTIDCTGFVESRAADFTSATSSGQLFFERFQQISLESVLSR
jgi:hypothetical protein